jgi:uncharacterized phage protein gp47/JayE
MTTEYGITDSGFVLKPFEDIKAEWEADLRSRFGPGIDLEPESVFGQFVAIASEREALLWEQAEAVYNADRPDAATGASLDTLAALTGALRLPSTQSAVILTCTGTPNTALAIGRTASVTGAGSKFDTTAVAEIVAVDAWAQNHAYVIGNRVTANSNVYQCITAGGSSPSGAGPSSTASDITDGTVHWRYLGAGTGAVDVDALAQQFGVVPAASGSITTIESAVSGWKGVINVLDAVVGRNAETDADFRVRRNDLLRQAGNAALDAIRAAIIRIKGVTSCTVFENATDSTDGYGRPPHCVEVMVLGGDPATIAATVWKSKAGGIATFGTSSQVVVDSNGENRTVYFSRPVVEDIYVIVNGTKDPNTYPANGDAQIKAAIVAWAATYYVIGRDVASSAIVPEVFSVSGITDCPPPKIGTSPNPTTSTTIVIDPRSQAVFDTSRITVNMTDG